MFKPKQFKSNNTVISVYKMHTVKGELTNAVRAVGITWSETESSHLY